MPGIVLTFVVAAALSQVTHGVLWAMAVGVLLATSQVLPVSLEPGIKLVQKHLLTVLIPLLALELTLANLLKVGGIPFALTAASLISTMGLGWLWCRHFNRWGAADSLTVIGTAVCGSSAIVATAPLVAEDKTGAPVALANINLIGTLEFCLAPILLGSVALSDSATAFVLGTTLPAVGHVVAAGAGLGANIASLALSYKLTRVLFLVPIMAVLSARRLATAGTSWSQAVPVYVYLFFAAIVVGNLLPDLALIPGYKEICRFLLTAFMFAVSMSINLRALAGAMSSSLLLGFVLTIWQVGFCFMVMGLLG